MRTVRLQTAGGDVVPVGVSAEVAGAAHSHVVALPDSEHHVQFALDARGSGLVVVGARRHRVVVVRDGGHLGLWIDGRVRTFDIMTHTARRRGASTEVSASTVLSAPMPGTLLEIRAGAGDVFEAHQPLVIMESMKMELTLSVPHSGRIAAVGCEPGDLVERGAELMRFEAPDEEGT